MREYMMNKTKWMLIRDKKKYIREKQCIFHKSSFFTRETSFEGRNVLASNAKLIDSKIGYASYLGSDTNLTHTMIGRYSAIGPEVTNIVGTHPSHQFVSVHPCFYSLLKQSGFTYAEKQQFEEYAYADDEHQYLNIIGNDVWIGERVMLMQGVTIGDGAIIGSGALVNKDVPPFAIVGGVPAKIIGWRFTEEEREFLLKLQWWNRGEKWIAEHAGLFTDIENFRSMTRKEVLI